MTPSAKSSSRAAAELQHAVMATVVSAEPLATVWQIIVGHVMA